MSSSENLNEFDTLVAIIARLRAPGGCPWDRKQSHASLRENLLEECYEVLEALDREDAGQLSDELGDLLMQIVFHIQIAHEEGEFELGDVVRGINTKLIHRHPHIFGSEKVSDAEEVALNWEALKQEEREGGTSILESVPRQMPALGRSHSIQRRVAQVGFDWPEVDGIIEKLSEEIGELKQAEDEESREREFGDVLFALVNIARRMGVDSEAALREANQRFTRRFNYMEETCRRRGIVFAKLSLDEQNALWEEAKEALKI
ncbi:nucleoside triphosphate pyrophosphohydrolase [Chloroflexota bacterium]